MQKISFIPKNARGKAEGSEREVGREEERAKYTRLPSQHISAFFFRGYQTFPPP